MSLDDNTVDQDPMGGSNSEPIVPPTLPDATELPNDSIAKPSWLHPTSLIFEMTSHFRELIIPLGIAAFSAAKGSRGGLYFALAFFVPAVLFSIFRYFTLRYKIDEGELIVKQGLIFRNTRTVPVSRIQNIDLVQNPLHRLFRVAEVRIETASGSEPEATLRVLSMQKVAKLRSLVFDSGRRANDAAQNSAAGATTLADGTSISLTEQQQHAQHGAPIGQRLLEIPTMWLIKAGAASNRGMLLLGIAFGAWFQFDLEEKVDFDQVRDLLPMPDGTLINTLAFAGMIVGVLLFLRLLGIIWFLLRFSGYQMTLFGEDIRITCGLFTKVSATIPRKRIQFISIHRPLFMRWFGFASIRIETAGGGGMSDDATTTVSRRWFVPVLPEDQVVELVNLLRPGLVWQEDALPWRSVAQATARRLIRLAVVHAVIFAAAGYAVVYNFGWFNPWLGVLLGPALLPILVLWARKKARAMRYARQDDLLVYRSGVLNRKTSMTFFDKVQTISVEQSPFDRRWGMASLTVDTAAAGPAEHRISVRYLDEGFAQAELAEIRIAASRFTPDFG